jgi:aldehyde dehydrogenase (NAD+)
MTRPTARELLEPFGIELGRDLLPRTPWAIGSGPPSESVDPTTGTPLARVPSATRSEYAAAVARAKERWQEWRMRPAPVRGELVRVLGARLRAQKDALGALVTLEMGKIRSEGLGEVQEMIDIADFAVGLSRQLYGLTIASERPKHRMMEQWHPLGPVGIVTAFNFPVAVWAWNAALAAVCGDTCVWKPSPRTPLASLAVHAICREVERAHDAEGLFQPVLGGADVGGFVADDPALPLVSFTGSIPGGRRVAERVAARLGRSLLELGGTNAILVL